LEHIKKAIEEKDGDIYSCSNYRHEEVLKQLKDIYHNKCCYCESKSGHVAPLQVEHFRPKKRLKKEKPGDEMHEGYYWLGYEWSNLLLSCPKCNGPDAKGTRFPISGKRVYHDSPFNNNGEINSFDRTRLIASNSPLADEKPLLLNPEYNDYDPKDHFKFDNQGEIIGITDRGKATIDICKLNRSELFLMRKKVVDQFLSEIKRLVYAYKIKKIHKKGFRFLLEDIFEDILKITKPEEEYCLWGQYIFKEFGYCISSQIPGNDSYELINQAFKEYCINRGSNEF
jgi:uncharacterized protein (TIGR02646 family)